MSKQVYSCFIPSVALVPPFENPLPSKKLAFQGLHAQKHGGGGGGREKRAEYQRCFLKRNRL